MGQNESVKKKVEKYRERVKVLKMRDLCAGVAKQRQTALVGRVNQ